MLLGISILPQTSEELFYFVTKRFPHLCGVWRFANAYVVMAMKGVGTSLGPQLMAEIGDVSRFTHKGAITAFAGVDPGVNESGSYEQKSVPTSKRGSSVLRKTLFQVMDVLIKTHPQDDPVYQFIDKKRTQGKPYYVYMTAGANKFLRIYYGRVKEYLSSLPES